jgi:hypothetical protein
MRIARFHIIGSSSERPTGSAVLYADGSADECFRPGQDLELSHWIPNRTPASYKADTSTEICMRFVAASPVGSWDLAINNHLDADGILSVFTLLHSEFALAHRKTIVQAAEMGDFWAFGERKAQILFEGLTLFMDRLRSEKEDPQTIYARSFDRVRSLLRGEFDSDPGLLVGIRALNTSLDLIDSGRIQRTLCHKRFVHYHVPASVVAGSPERALAVPPFNAPLSGGTLSLPQARNRDDRERIQVVSIESGSGWYYDLWYPGYMWAETPHSWVAPGLQFSGSTNGYYYAHESMARAVREIQALEKGSARWTLAENVSPFETIQGRNFPIVLSCIDDRGTSAVSSIPPDLVVPLLSSVFQAEE